MHAAISTTFRGRRGGHHACVSDLKLITMYTRASHKHAHVLDVPWLYRDIIICPMLLISRRAGEATTARFTGWYSEVIFSSAV